MFSEWYLRFPLISLPAMPPSRWRPAQGPLTTRWTDTVTPENVWPEYPRPQMTREAWMNLNGLWDYAIGAKDQEQPQTWDGAILVPFCAESALSGVMRKVQPDERLWYRRSFVVPEAWEGQRVLLHFGAVDWEATVWVNGIPVGTHRGGYDPFTFDITETLRPGENELVVAVWDPTDTGYQPRGKQVLEPQGIWYTAVTGIWQTVWLEPVPDRFIRKLVIHPDVDASLVRVEVDAPEDETVQIQVLQEGQPIAEAEGKPGQPIPVPLEAPRLWSPDDPHLYDLNVRLSSGDTVRSYFGMRKIEVRKDDRGVNRLFLNGEPLFQYGPLDQGWWPDGLYTAPCDEALRYDIEVTKKLGMNLARKHVKVEPQRWYTWADRLGLLVWQDMPSGNFQQEGGPENYERELKRMVESFFNHPSIVMWVPFNEGWGQHDTERYVQRLREWDPSRLINNASGWTDMGVGDVCDVHRYPGPAIPPLEEARAAVLGEFGGLGLPLPGHTWQDEKNWGYRSYSNPEELTRAYEDLLRSLRFLIGQGLAAAVYTQTTDVEIEVNGLMTYDRAVIKMDEARARAAALPLYRPAPILEMVVPTSQEQAQTWRYTTEAPDEGWYREDFDDTTWQEGPGGFGTEGTPGAVVRTEWNTSDIWIRRTFTLETVPEEVQLLIHHDEDVEVYLNGQLVEARQGYTTSYLIAPGKVPIASVLRQGRNTLAVHCHQTQGGQYIDVGLITARDQG